MGVENFARGHNGGKVCPRVLQREVQVGSTQKWSASAGVQGSGVSEFELAGDGTLL